MAIMTTLPRTAVEGPAKGPLRLALERFYLRVVFKLRPRNVRSLYGPRLRGNFADATFGFYVRADYGHFLSELLGAIRQPFVFLDIGANQGLYALLAADNPHCITAWAFEPVQATYDLLADNIRLNGHEKRIIPVQAAISDADGEKRIHINRAHTGVASLEHAVGDEVGETIRCISAAMLDATVKVDGGVPILVKIDTEGHEPTVIATLRKTRFWPDVQSLFFEVDTKWYDGEQIVRELADDGFAESYRTSQSDHYDVLVQRT
jgi:FkbM family methyltransferase